MFVVEPLNDGSQITIFNNATKNRQKLFSQQLPYLPEQLSKQLRISRQGARFTLSGSFDDGVISRSIADILSDYAHLDEDELALHITGIDRGVIRPIQSSDGLVVQYSPDEVASLRQQAVRKSHYQRILARKKRLNKNKNKYKAETHNQRKLAAKITRCDQKITDIRVNFSHTASKKVVNDAKAIISLEDLKLKNMTKKAKPKREDRPYLRNNGRAKSGLNRSLSNVALGRLGDFIRYKAEDAGKAVVEVNPAYTSRTCHRCQSKNTTRPDQATFICLACGFSGNADDNASKVIAQRAIVFIKENKFADKVKSRKTIARRKKWVVNPPLVPELASG